MSKMFDYIRGFPFQLMEGYRIGKQTTISTGDFDSVILCGMGGSAIGGDLLAGFAKPEMNIPFIINRGYSLPGWVNENTLVILSSHSGNTGETLSCFEEALRRNCFLIGITSGGKLKDAFNDKGLSISIIPGGMPPRAALGYSFAALFAIFENLGFIKAGIRDIVETVDLLKILTDEYSIEDGAPFRLAKEISEKIPVFYADGYRWDAVVCRFRSQINENAKTLAFGNTFTEFNHNEIVGWGLPKFTLERLVAIFLWDDETISPVRKQMEIAHSIMADLKLKVYNIESKGNGFLARMMSMVSFADWLSYHLAIIKGVEPIPINRIDLLKSKL